MPSQSVLLAMRAFEGFASGSFGPRALLAAFMFCRARTAADDDGACRVFPVGRGRHRLRDVRRIRAVLGEPWSVPRPVRGRVADGTGGTALASANHATPLRSACPFRRRSFDPASPAPRRAAVVAGSGMRRHRFALVSARTAVPSDSLSPLSASDSHSNPVNMAHHDRPIPESCPKISCTSIPAFLAAPPRAACCLPMSWTSFARRCSALRVDLSRPGRRADSPSVRRLCRRHARRPGTHRSTPR